MIGRLITGHNISTLAVVGWMVYTLSLAVVLPYSLLAAARGKQATVLAVAFASSTLSLVVVAALAHMVGSVGWVPFGLIGSFAGAVVIRQYMLRSKWNSDQPFENGSDTELASVLHAGGRGCVSRVFADW